VISPALYSLSPGERKAIENLLLRVGPAPSLEQLWSLMDEAWSHHGCNNNVPTHETLNAFYEDPVWLLNGMFIEQDELSMSHRRSIVSFVQSLAPQSVVDFGGGFGTLARLLSSALPESLISICEPYPTVCGVENCRQMPNISFVPSLQAFSCDVLVCTDVLEHVTQPIKLLAAMVDAVRLGGHLVIANCFYPVISCHLPSTFHLRYSFDSFCQVMGLDVIGLCPGSHATIYRRNHSVPIDWSQLEAMERRSKSLYGWREWRTRHITPWRRHVQQTMIQSLRYSRRLLIPLEPNR
jgi:hypothetical protein